MRKYLFLFLLALDTSCTNNKEIDSINSNVQTISFTAQHEKLNFSDIYDIDFEVVKLETIKESMFAIPTSTKLTKDYIFILDQTKRVFLIFNRNGSFYKKLIKEGKGPGEYANITAFAVDEENKLVYIYDDIQQKIITYDFSLNFIREKKISFYFLRFNCLKDGNFVFYTSLMSGNKEKYRYDILVTDNNFEVRDKILPYSFTNGGRGYVNDFCRLSADKISFYTNYSDIIYEIEYKKIIEKYKILDFGEHELPPQDFYLKREKKGDGNSVVSNEIFNSNYIYSYLFFEDEYNIIIFYTAEKKDYVSLIDKQTNKQLCIDKLIDDFGLFLDRKFSRPYFFHKGQLGYYIFPYLAFEEKEKNPSRYVNPILSDMSIEQNPILVLLNLKH